MANGIIDPWATNQPVAVTHSKINLHDKTGLAFTKPKPESEPSAAAAADPNAASNRRRSLNLWMDAADSEIALATVEHGVSSCTLLATDALHENLIVEKSRGETAVVKTADLLSAELRGSWRLSCPLPPRPTWIDADPPIPARAASSKPEKEEEEAATSSSAAAASSSSSAATLATASAPLEKYFIQRYMLFSKFDDGVALDDEGWYSVTPEVLARHMAERCRCDLIVDAFCGVGGNAIQFAHTCERVIAVDLDASRLQYAAHNAKIYGVNDRIEWLHADFFDLAPSTLHADVFFLSPPWGGPEYASAKRFDLVTMMGGLDGAEILRHALKLAPSVAYFLPRNADLRQLKALAREHGVPLELERCWLNGHEKGLMAYFNFLEAEEEEEEEDLF